jgi:hypothetical protein
MTATKHNFPLPRLLAGILLVFCLFVAQDVGSQVPEAVDPVLLAQVKAAYLRHLAEFTYWPENEFNSKEDPIVIAVSGDDPGGVGLFLESAKINMGMTAQGRPLKIIRIPEDLLPPEADPPLHILYVTSTSYDQLAEILPAYRKKGILVVGEDKEFLKAGGMVCFAIALKDNPGTSDMDYRVKMGVNLEAISEESFQISTRLLRMKSVVDIFAGGNRQY